MRFWLIRQKMVKITFFILVGSFSIHYFSFQLLVFIYRSKEILKNLPKNNS